MRLFKEVPNIDEINKIRELRTVDIVKRIGVLSPNRVHLKNYPINNPISIFNASLIIKGDEVKVFARMVMGYFMYASAIILIELSYDDLQQGYVNTSHYPAEMVIFPNTEYDLWGAEDPRVYEIDNMLFVTYCGRTVNYFNPAIRFERTLPVTAVSYNLGREWIKTFAFTLPENIRKMVISDKDAFLLKTDRGDILLFHRPHLTDEKCYLVVSKVPEDVIEKCKKKELEGIKRIEVKDTTIVLKPMDFELKLGWSTPPVKVGSDEYILLVHGVDKTIECYRVFAILLKYDGEVHVSAITPYYIMEPRATYEIYGDRPYTVFPCGIQKVDDNLIISYGASDFVVGFGKIDLTELLSILDKYRIE